MSELNQKRLIILLLGITTITAGVFTWRAGQIASTAAFDDRTAVGQTIDQQEQNVAINLRAIANLKSYVQYVADYAEAAALDDRAAEYSDAGSASLAQAMTDSATSTRAVASERAAAAGVFGRTSIYADVESPQPRPRDFDFETHRKLIESEVTADIYRSMAFTDTESEAYDQAVADLTRAIDLGGDADVVNLTTAAMTLFGRGDYEDATLALDTAIEVNDDVAILPFARSAAAVAQGDGDGARHWRDKGIELLGPLSDSDRNREVGALYYTMLAKVADDRPEQADLADEILDETIAFVSDIASGGKLSGDVPDDVAFAPSQVTFADDQTTVDLRATGIPPDAWVTVVGYERPAEGAGWVQPAELFYTGQTIGEGSLTIDTPRNCDPIEWRFDLYVNGAPADSMTLPGVEATC